MSSLLGAFDLLMLVVQVKSKKKVPFRTLKSAKKVPFFRFRNVPIKRAKKVPFLRLEAMFS